MPAINILSNGNILPADSAYITIPLNYNKLGFKQVALGFLITLLGFLAS
jgi:hypothetical protein